MIRGLLSKDIGYRTKAAESLGKIYSIEERQRERLKDSDEIYAIINAMLSLATANVMRNESLAKKLPKESPKGYSYKLTSKIPFLNKSTVFNKIFGGYEFYRGDKPISREDYMYNYYLQDKEE